MFPTVKHQKSVIAYGIYMQEILNTSLFVIIPTAYGCLLDADFDTEIASLLLIWAVTYCWRLGLRQGRYSLRNPLNILLLQKNKLRLKGKLFLIARQSVGILYRKTLLNSRGWNSEPDPL